MIAFETPSLLLALLLLPAYVFARQALRRRGGGPRPSLGAFGDPVFDEAPLLLRSLHYLRLFLLCLGFIGLVLAAAGPVRISRRVLYLSRGNEILIVLDVSPSMAASDFEPSRIEAAKRIIEGFLDTRRNERVGLVAFGGESALVAPPTLDYGAIRSRLALLEPGMLGEGTAIGAGLATALAHGSRSSAPERHILLLTDGESNAGPVAPGAAASLASQNGFRLSVVGIGMKGEVPLSYRDPATGRVRTGSYLSGFDRAALESLARRGGGAYYDAENAEALAEAFSALAERSASLSKTRSLAAEEPLSALLLALCLAALGLARLLGLAAGSELP